uniref:Cytomegalovirus DNA for mtrIII region n=1 Tax=Human cytomegalovirus TaxID=10359 RepID=Q68831_HCMV|nr:unnamed protein product [Human betaherpesvirus 5]
MMAAIWARVLITTWCRGVGRGLRKPRPRHTSFADITRNPRRHVSRMPARGVSFAQHSWSWSRSGCCFTSTSATLQI